jgi:hypothetical protein
MHDERVADLRADLAGEFVTKNDGIALEVKLALLEVLAELLQQAVFRLIRHADDADALQIALVLHDDDAFRHRHGGDDLGTRGEGFAQLTPVRVIWARHHASSSAAPSHAARSR